MDWTPTQVVALRTTALRMSLLHFARHVGVSVGSVRNWERGDRPPSPASKRQLDAAHDRLKPSQRERLRAVLAPQAATASSPAATVVPGADAPNLGAVGSEAARLPKPLAEVDFDELAQTLMAWADHGQRGMSRREALSKLSTALAVAAVGPALADLDEVDRLGAVLGESAAVDAAALDHTQALVLACRRQGDVLGPQVALQTVLAQRQMIAGMLKGTHGPLRERVLSLYAEVTQLAGWSLFNLGRYEDADRWYHQARVLAHEAEDSDLVTYVLSAMSQLATWRGQPRVGIDHAAAAATWASTSHARAYAADVAVKAFSAAGQRQQALRALEDEQQAVSTMSEGVPASHWWYFYDEAFSLQTAALRALRFHEPEAAHLAVNQSLNLIDATNLHNFSFDLLYRAEAFIQQGEFAEAGGALVDVASLACTGASLRIQQHVRQLRVRLDHAGDLEVVRELDDRLHQLTAGGATAG